MNRVNVAKGKKVETSEDFCKVFGDLDVTKKTEVIKNLQKTLDTGLSPSGIKLKEGQRNSVERLVRWSTVNLLVGNELCPPVSLQNY